MMGGTTRLVVVLACAGVAWGKRRHPAANDCAMTFRDLDSGLPGGSSYWIYNPTVVRATAAAYQGLARVSLAVGDEGRCRAVEREAGAAADAIAAAEAVLYCRKWFVGGFRDVVVQWWAPASAPCDARVVRVLDEGEDPRLYRAGDAVRMTLQRWELLAFDGGGRRYDVVRALYESPVAASGAPERGDVYATRLVHRRGRADRGCAAFARFTCPTTAGARYRSMPIESSWTLRRFAKLRATDQKKPQKMKVQIHLGK